MIYIDFNLGFREPTKINLMFKEVIKDMVQKERWILPVDMNR
jgi:hypothetical protein